MATTGQLVPAPSTDVPRRSGLQTAVLAGGCFWGLEAVFERVKGVQSVVSGYAGGEREDANYERVSSERTRHAEAVRIRYDPTKVSYGTLLRIYFSVTTDPTQLNRQGPDVGTQYRSEIFYANPAQQKIAAAYVDQLGKAKVFSRPIVTKQSALGRFTVAEDYHQNYANEHPNEPYIRFNDAPKVEALKKDLASIYKEELSAWTDSR